VPNALAQEEQVAAAVAVLASDEAGFVPGAALHVDGGGWTDCRHGPKLTPLERAERPASAGALAIMLLVPDVGAGTVLHALQAGTLGSADMPICLTSARASVASMRDCSRSSCQASRASS
jgi:hypothetical protein